MKLSKIIVAVIIALSILFISFLVKQYKLMDIETTNSKYYYNEKFDKEDSILFKNIELKKMKSVFEIKSSFRKDIKCFNYNNLGKLHFTKIDLAKDIPMDQFIWFRERPTSTTTMHSYFDLNRSVFDFMIREEKVGTVSKLIFSMTGKGNQLHRKVYNKNFVSYYLPVSTFSLRYGEDAPTDIFFGGKEALFGGRNTYPLMISFYKIHKSLYVLILVPDKNDMNLEDDLFGKIMNDNSKE